MKITAWAQEQFDIKQFTKHPHMQVKSQKQKEAALREHDPDILLSFLGQSKFQME